MVGTAGEEYAEAKDVWVEEPPSKAVKSSKRSMSESSRESK